MLRSKIKITHNFLDAVIFYVILYYILFGIWIGAGINQIQNVIVCLCIARSLFYCIRSRRLYGQLILYVVVLTVFLGLNFLTHNSNSLFWENMYYIISCWSIVIYIAILLKSEGRWLEKFMIQISKIVNIYMCINIIVMFFQLNESYFLIDKNRIPSVVYYPDYIAGFFGINGTHRLTLFCIFFICLNMYIYRFRMVKQYKKIPLFVALISILLFALSTQNDNNTFFILYPLFALFLYSILYTMDYKRIGKLCLVILGSVIILEVIVSTNSHLLQEISDRLGDIVQVYVFGNKNVWDERTELMTYALTHGKGFLFGSGIGSVKMYSELSISSHWGMNSLMTFTYFMGVVPLILYAALHIIVLTNSIGSYVQKTKLIIQLGLLVLFMLVIQYCQVLSEMNLMILFTMIVSLFVLTAKKLYNEKIERV